MRTERERQSTYLIHLALARGGRILELRIADTHL
jgi:hypothetical protein